MEIALKVGVTSDGDGDGVGFEGVKGNGIGESIFQVKRGVNTCSDVFCAVNDALFFARLENRLCGGGGDIALLVKGLGFCNGLSCGCDTEGE